MTPSDPIEPFLRRVVPGLESCVGASAEEAAELEKRAGQPLPPFYRWFLHTMGRDMGPLATGIDLSVNTTLKMMRDVDSGNDEGEWDDDELLRGYIRDIRADQTAKALATAKPKSDAGDLGTAGATAPLPTLDGDR